MYRVQVVVNEGVDNWVVHRCLYIYYWEFSLRADSLVETLDEMRWDEIRSNNQQTSTTAFVVASNVRMQKEGQFARTVTPFYNKKKFTWVTFLFLFLKI